MSTFNPELGPFPLSREIVLNSISKAFKGFTDVEIATATKQKPIGKEKTDTNIFIYRGLNNFLLGLLRTNRNALKQSNSLQGNYNQFAELTKPDSLDFECRLITFVADNITTRLPINGSSSVNNQDNYLGQISVVELGLIMPLLSQDKRQLVTKRLLLEWSTFARTDNLNIRDTLNILAESTGIKDTIMAQNPDWNTTFIGALSVCPGDTVSVIRGIVSNSPTIYNLMFLENVKGQLETIFADQLSS